MPESRQRKKTVARKRPRVPHSNPAPNAPQIPGSRNARIGVLILVAVIAIAGVVYVLTRNTKTQTVWDVTTPSGLKIQDLKVGDGPSPKMGQTVRVHYIGRFENGQEFNNSYKMGSPAEFRLGGVIEGWNEALQTMKVGGKRKIWVPSKIGYGAAGKAPTIPPNANLEFEIELLGVK
ncbi:MAG TPA: FKBP-type peptidyl-prolyl cis-trans isomerase [Pyrinomonadaceae bacterium]|nr:FKBP-type peptidyl-prolyl cis-trans isomerase [Pyrinomonadaceae bacterium]